MKSSKQDKTDGKIYKGKGDLKEIARKHINDPDLETERKDLKVVGKEDLPNDHILMSGKQKARTIR